MLFLTNNFIQLDLTTVSYLCTLPPVFPLYCNSQRHLILPDCVCVCVNVNMKGMGPSKGFQPRPEAVGDWKDYWGHVEGPE